MPDNWILERGTAPEITSGAVRFIGTWDVRFAPDYATGTTNCEGTDMLRVFATLTIDHNDEEVITAFASGWPVFVMHRNMYDETGPLGGGTSRVHDCPGWELASRRFWEALGGDLSEGHELLNLMELIAAKAGWDESGLEA